MTIFSKDILEVLAGLGSRHDIFCIEDVRNENVFYHVESEADEVTQRRLDRAAVRQDKNSLNEDPAMGQLSRRRVPMHKASAAVREPQSYLTEPGPEEPGKRAPRSYLTEPEPEEPGKIKRSKLSLHDALLGDPDEIHYGFGLEDELEEDSEEAPDIYHSYGYGHGRQSGRRPGYAARSAGYITGKSE